MSREHCASPRLVDVSQPDRREQRSFERFGHFKIKIGREKLLILARPTLTGRLLP